MDAKLIALIYDLATEFVEVQKAADAGDRNLSSKVKKLGDGPLDRLVGTAARQQAAARGISLSDSMTTEEVLKALVSDGKSATPSRVEATKSSSSRRIFPSAEELEKSDERRAPFSVAGKTNLGRISSSSGRYPIDQQRASIAAGESQKDQGSDPKLSPFSPSRLKRLL